MSESCPDSWEPFEHADVVEVCLTVEANWRVLALAGLFRVIRNRSSPRDDDAHQENATLHVVLHAGPQRQSRDRPAALNKPSCRAGGAMFQR
jgi:hypothetical protein